MTTGHDGSRMSAAFAAALALLAAGCLDIDLTIRINDDGSATVAERIRFSEEILDLAAIVPAKEGLAVLLEKERAAQRGALMGKGAQLASHQVRDLPGGIKECVAVYSIPDVNDLRICSPAVAWMDYEVSPMVIEHAPHYTDGSGYNIGAMTVNTFTPRKRRDWGPENRDGRKPPPPAASPAELQKYRELLPVFKDLMRDFHLKVVIACYSPVGWATARLAREQTRDYVLLEFGDRNLDQYGAHILDSEEFMLALIRWDLTSPHIMSVVRHLAQNLTVPVWLPQRGMGLGGFGEDRYLALRPSKYLFEKYFKGKPRYYGGDLDIPRPGQITREDLIKWGIIKKEP